MTFLRTETVGEVWAHVRTDPDAVLGMRIDLYATRADAVRAKAFHRSGEIQPIKVMKSETGVR